MSPSPFYQHQRLVTLLAARILNFAESKGLGEVIVAPFDVYLEEFTSAVQPDILFISRKTIHILKDDGYAHGAPDMIVEILSQNELRDRTLKKELYEKAGVKEYFMVDPKTQMIEAFVLKGKKYQPAYRRKKFFKSDLLKLEFTF